jgi:hypothetical protein
MVEKPRRSWFTFSLRTMFVVMTVLCCWLAWESNVVRQRQSVLRDLKTKPGIEVTTAADWAMRFDSTATVPPPAQIPLVRRWLGDEAIQEIGYIENYYEPPPELSRLARIFPEAKLQRHILEPCHPGCFPRGTLVDTPPGPQPIDSIQPGDLITAVLSTGEVATVKAQFVFVTENHIWKVDTSLGTLYTTQTQPLCPATGETCQVEKLKPGDHILCRQDEELQAAEVLEVSRTDRTEKVFNLILGDSEVFIANGFLARSKPPARLASQ